MLIIELDRVDTPAGRRIRVRWRQPYYRLNERHYADNADGRALAESFAARKMTRSRCVVSSLDMTPAQLAAKERRETRMRETLAGIGA